MKPIVLLLLFGVTHCLHAQIQQLNLSDDQFGCSYIGEPESKNVYAFETNSEAVDIINQIMAQSGLEPNFRVYAADVSNAEARVIKGERVIIYNQNFIHEVRQKTGSDWAATSILAHEVAHHLQGHTIKPGGSRPGLELESDKWSGFILYKLGASLDQAQLAMKTLGSEVASATHPAKNDRIQAIAVGWTNARHMDKKSNQGNIDGGIKPVATDKVNPPPINPPPGNPGNVNPNHSNSNNTEFINRTNFHYRGSLLFTTQANVQFLINGMWYTPPANEFYIDNIPFGNQTYRVSGTLTVYTELLGDYTVNIDNTGYVNVEQNGHLYIFIDYNWDTDQFSVRLSPIDSY